MPRDNRLYLDDILLAIEKIRIYTKNFSEDDFRADFKTQDAVLRNLEIIGEAAGKIEESLKSKTKEIEWRKITAMRNILAHEYFGISIPIIWDIIETKISPLEDSCRSLLEKLEKE